MQDIVLFIQHHWLLALALIVVLSTLLVLEFMNQKRGSKQLSPAQATLLINHSDAIVVDIRNTSQFTEGHIIGALSIPLEEIKDKWKKLEKFKSQPVVIVCMSGTDSPRAASLLTEQGFSVRILAGGIRAWLDADMPLVKG